MTFNRSAIFNDAWTLARKHAKKSGSSLKAMFKMALGIVWAITKEAARKAKLPPNAWAMGAPVHIAAGPYGGGMLRASALAPAYNPW